MEIKEKAKQAAVGEPLTFRWSYTILPVVVLLLSIIMVAYFYRLLPSEVAYHFGADGSPDKWFSRSTAILLTLLPQFLLTLLALGLTWGISRLSVVFRQIGSSSGKMVGLMGNMIALPQIVLCFAMLDIFSYNSYQVRLLPLWVFALIVMLLGGIVLGVFFVQAIRQNLKAGQK